MKHYYTQNIDLKEIKMKNTKEITRS